MLSFVNDYCQGACPEILERLASNNLVKMTGYGEDEICRSAAEKIRKAAGAPDAQIYFLTGGTQTNQVVIDTVAAPFEGVLAADTGHVNTHEAGAIEFTGHKVLTIPNADGKLTADGVRAFMEAFYADDNHEHEVFPGIVYISHPSESGTLYTKAELTALHEVCASYELPLYMDGARLAYGLTSDANDLSLADIARLTDVFYIGGTKCGAFFGEAVVFPHGTMPRRFNTQVKRHGAMMAKGWLAGLQFDVLFTDDLYERLGRNANVCAARLREGLRSKGYTLYIDAPTNQVYVLLTNAQKNALAERVRFSFWENVDPDHTAIRFCTSWATTPEEIEALIAAL